MNRDTRGFTGWTVSNSLRRGGNERLCHNQPDNMVELSFQNTRGTDCSRKHQISSPPIITIPPWYSHSFLKCIESKLKDSMGGFKDSSFHSDTFCFFRKGDYYWLFGNAIFRLQSWLMKLNSNKLCVCNTNEVKPRPSGMGFTMHVSTSLPNITTKLPREFEVEGNSVEGGYEG